MCSYKIHLMNSRHSAPEATLEQCYELHCLLATEETWLCIDFLNNMTVLLGSETLVVFNTLQGCDMEICRANTIIFAWNHVYLLWTLAKIFATCEMDLDPGVYLRINKIRAFTPPDFLTQSLTCFSPEHYVHLAGKSLQVQEGWAESCADLCWDAADT